MHGPGLREHDHLKSSPGIYSLISAGHLTCLRAVPKWRSLRAHPRKRRRWWVGLSSHPYTPGPTVGGAKGCITYSFSEISGFLENELAYPTSPNVLTTGAHWSSNDSPGQQCRENRWPLPLVFHRVGSHVSVQFKEWERSKQQHSTKPDIDLWSAMFFVHASKNVKGCGRGKVLLQGV